MTSHILIGEVAQLRQAVPNELENSRVLFLDLGALERPSDWAVHCASRLLNRLREDAAIDALSSLRTVVLAAFPPVRTPEEFVHRAAAIQSLRGIVQSVTREYVHRLSPLNLVAVERETLGDAARTIHFLDAANGSYTAGSTIDLTTTTAVRS